MTSKILATILCVDDEPNILSALRRLFRASSYRFLAAGSGDEALSILEDENGNVDLVISDMRMPNMDGSELLAEVRQRWPSVVRILLTGYADMDSTIRAINDGAIFRYIPKPWNDHEVLMVVKELVERLELEREKLRLELLTARQNEELRSLNATLEEKVRERTEELRGAHDKLKRSFLMSMQVFSNLIELRGGRVGGHSRRVADLARKIAGEMGLDMRACNDIFIAGLLHDIGKIGLQDILLSMPVNRMNTDQAAQYRKHAIRGEQALMALEELRNAARIIRSHHERYDGQGFPDGLASDLIPLGARIIAVANDYDAFVQGTMTGRSCSSDDAKKLIIQSRGKRYDPVVVDAFVALSGAPAGEPADEMAISPRDLKPGMRLARDLVSAEGALLLATDYVLNESVVRQIQDYEEEEQRPIMIYVRRSRLPGMGR